MNLNDVSMQSAFHGTEYLLRIIAKDSVLKITATEKYTGETWKNEFAFPYLETLVSKAGGFESGTDFIQLLENGIRQESSAVSLDILSNYDLDKTSIMQRKYLVLTRQSESEKIHYPLPLIYEEDTDPQTLRSTISRLAREIKEATQGTTPLVLENEELKRKIQKRSEENELADLTEKLVHAQQKLKTEKEKLSKMKEEGLNNTTSIKDGIANLSKELAKAQNETEVILKRQRKEINEAKQKIEEHKKTSNKLKKRIKGLENELEVALDRNKRKRSCSVPGVRRQYINRSTIANKVTNRQLQYSSGKPEKENLPLLNKGSSSKKEFIQSKISKLNNELSTLKLEDIGSRLNTLKNIIESSKIQH